MTIKREDKNAPKIITRIVALLFGNPGTGKSSIALTSRRPLYFDFDEGYHRTSNPQLAAGNVVMPNRWEDIDGLDENDLKDNDTIVIDTIGVLVLRLADYLCRKNPKLRQDSGNLTTDGWISLKANITLWLERMKSYGVDIVLVSHASEEMKGSDRVLRLDVWGKGARSLVEQSCTLMADMSKHPDENGEEKYWFDTGTGGTFFGKNPGKLPMPIEVPDPLVVHDTLARIIDQTKDAINARLELSDDKRAWTERLTKESAELLERGDEAASLKWCNDMAAEMGEKNADANSKKVLVMLGRRFGFEFDRETGFTAPGGAAEAAPAEKPKRTRKAAKPKAEPKAEAAAQEAAQETGAEPEQGEMLPEPVAKGPPAGNGGGLTLEKVNKMLAMNRQMNLGKAHFADVLEKGVKAGFTYDTDMEMFTDGA